MTELNSEEIRELIPDGLVGGKVEDLISGLQGWHLAREKANRRNRNMLQYAAGVAALVGVGSGTGGINQVAKALSAQKDVVVDLGWMQSLAFFEVAGAVALIVPLVFAYLQRRAAEQDMERHLARLIALVPSRFLKID